MSIFTLLPANKVEDLYLMYVHVRTLLVDLLADSNIAYWEVV